MTHKIFITLLLFVAMVSGPVAAQTADDSLRQKVDEIFSDYDRESTPGCAISVFKEGQSVFNKGYGIANLDYGIEISDSTSFYMASVSKHVTAAAAQLLIIRGELNDNDYVSEYIEDWPEWAGEVKVSHLFNHTSGLPDIYGLMSFAGMDINDVMELDEYMEVVKNGEELMFEPGSDYSYSNSGYTTLAFLVQQISEVSFPEFVDREFFKPFGMNSTHFHNDRTRIIPNRAISYMGNNDNFRRTYPGNFQGVGPGGLYSTLQDWERWEQFWNGSLEWDGGISSDEAVELKNSMIAPTFAGGEEIDYRKGLRVNMRKGTELVSHGGSFRGFKTNYARFTDRGYSFVTLCNRGDADPERLNMKTADLFMKDFFEGYLRSYEGRYINNDLPAEYVIKAEDGNLHLERRLSPNGEMNEEEKDVWSAGSWEFEFARNEEGEVSGFYVSTGRAEDVEFSKIKN